VRAPWLTVLGWLALTRLVILGIGFVGVATFVDFQTLRTGGPAALSVEGTWQKWDAVWYERIAREGYDYEPGDVQGQAKAAFFPLYPLTIGLLLKVVPFMPFFWLGAALSTLFTFAACVLLVRELVPASADPQRVLVLLLAGAGSFYFSLPYTEGLFLLLVVGTMTLTRHRWYALAGLVAGLSAVTRVHGLALIAVPLLACWLDRRQPPSVRARGLAGSVALFGVPLAIYLAYLSVSQGSAGAFIDRQAGWSNTFPYPLRALVQLAADHPRRVQAYLHGGIWLLYVAVTARYLRARPPGEILFCLGALVISTQQETFQGIYRYSAVLVPLVLAIADDRRPVQSAFLAVNVIFGTIMILAFVTGNRLAV
jgi:hypothetical protein